MKEINYSELETLFTAALANLESQKAYVNSLNVFPVPDGDTGTNMSLTLKTALEEAQKAHPQSMKESVSALSAGSLIGARGNSGVILSQIIRGMATAADSKQALTTEDFTQMLMKATEVAYKAVVTPVEGTILTVIRRMAECAATLHEEEYIPYMKELLQTGRQAVKETTSQLPALAEAHVVDAGGQGLVLLFEGMLKSLSGEAVSSGVVEGAEQKEEHEPHEKLRYRYDTVLLVSSENLPKEEISAKLTAQGDSLVMASAGGLTKIHVHTNEPYEAMRYLMTFAPLREGHIEDMQYEADKYAGEATGKAEQPESEPLASTEGCNQKDIHHAFVVVSPGPGFDEIFKHLGAHVIIGGGDTMNPPTEAFLDPIKACSAESFLVFPNNKNIIMAARQAAQLLKKDIHVLDARHPVQAVAALIQLASCSPEEDYVKVAADAIKATDFFAVTQATKDASVSGIAVHERDYMLLVDDHLVAVGTTEEDVLSHLSAAPIAWKEKSLLSLYRGKDYQEGTFDALSAKLAEMFPDLEVQPYFGGQSFYSVVGSIE